MISNKTNSLQISASRSFPKWLISQNASIAFTTYQVGKIFTLGTDDTGKMSISERTFNRCMGIGGDSQTFWMSSMYQLWRFENTLLSGQSFQGYDRVYIPRMAYTTGDLDIHDVAIDENGKPIFVNTLFNCLATVSDSHSFKPVWKPWFISELVPEDRCHLNGLAMKNGKAGYVTAVSISDVPGGWRDARSNGGILVDVQSNDVVCERLSMPHSPRLYQNKLWLLEAGSGYFGYVDMKSGAFVRVSFCPGFLRGLAFIGNYALIGVSTARNNNTFQGLELQKNLEKKKEEAWCGIWVINLHTGNTEHWVKIDGLIEELYDVLVLKATRRPLLIGTKKEDIKKMVSIEEG